MKIKKTTKFIIAAGLLSAISIATPIVITSCSSNGLQENHIHLTLKIV